MSEKRKLNLYLDGSLIDRLKELANVSGVSVSSLTERLFAQLVTQTDGLLTPDRNKVKELTEDELYRLAGRTFIEGAAYFALARNEILKQQAKKEESVES